MERELTEVYCGNGKGKTALAIGQSIREAVQGKSVIVIQFLKGCEKRSLDFMEDLDNLDFKIFRFEKSETDFVALSEDKKQEEIVNIKNGLNFAKKVLTTGECDLLILDEVLGLIDNEIITVEDLKNLLEARDGETDIIMTGISLNDDLCLVADEVSRIETLKFKRW